MADNKTTKLEALKERRQHIINNIRDGVDDYMTLRNTLAVIDIDIADEEKPKDRERLLAPFGLKKKKKLKGKRKSATSEDDDDKRIVGYDG